VGGRRVPLDAQQRLRINFVGPPDSFPLVPFHEFLDAARHGRRPPVDVRGAVVIVGVTGRSLQDYHPTPYANKVSHRVFNVINPVSLFLRGGAEPGLMSGPEFHANVLATLADGRYLYTPPWPLSLAVLLAVGVGLGQTFARLNLWWGFLVALGHHFTWKVVSLVMFSFFDVRVEMVAMLILGFLAYGVAFGLRWRRLRRMLGVYKSEAIARALEADAAPLELKGEKRVVTVLFADIRDFTTFSEQQKRSPEQVVALLNEYFTAVVPAIEGHGGTLTTYIGDGVMVLFGAPLSQPDHALRAVLAAVDMVQEVHRRKPRWAELDNPAMRIGVGVHTGEVVLGTVGSPRRLDYTAIGDTVNTAARIEAENKHLGTEILISAQTYAALPPGERGRLDIAGRPEPVHVKGKNQTVEVHRIPMGADMAPGPGRGPGA
jgi:adenylate cyclase